MTCCLLAFYIPPDPAVLLELSNVCRWSVCYFYHENHSYLSSSGLSPETPQLYFVEAIRFSRNVIFFFAINLTDDMSLELYGHVDSSFVRSGTT